VPPGDANFGIGTLWRKHAPFSHAGQLTYINARLPAALDIRSPASWGERIRGDRAMLLGPMVLIVLAVVCLAIMLFMMRGRVDRAGDRDAVAILKERYVLGEIDQAEYEERRRFLGG
jgi:hypothetical protein